MEKLWETSLVMLTVTPVNNDSILAFTNVDENGKFSLIIDAPTFAQLKIIVTGFNVKTIEKIIKNGNTKSNV